jgi:hypothetical protein
MRLLSILCLLALAIGGCAVAPRASSEVRVPTGGYAAAFDAARETLLARRFELERVDARAGVITTRPKSSSGLATPWDTEQSTLTQEVEDLFNRQQRHIRITFEPAAPGETPDDLRTVSGALTARVEVVIERLHRPGWQIEPAAVRFSSYTRDPALASRGLWPAYAVPFAQDPALAAAIEADIAARLSR